MIFIHTRIFSYTHDTTAVHPSPKPPSSLKMQNQYKSLEMSINASATKLCLTATSSHFQNKPQSGAQEKTSKKRRRKERGQHASVARTQPAQTAARCTTLIATLRSFSDQPNPLHSVGICVPAAELCAQDTKTIVRVILGELVHRSK